MLQTVIKIKIVLRQDLIHNNALCRLARECLILPRFVHLTIQTYLLFKDQFIACQIYLQEASESQP